MKKAREDGEERKEALEMPEAPSRSEFCFLPSQLPSRRRHFRAQKTCSSRTNAKSGRGGGGRPREGDSLFLPQPTLSASTQGSTSKKMAFPSAERTKYMRDEFGRRLGARVAGARKKSETRSRKFMVRSGESFRRGVPGVQKLSHLDGEPAQAAPFRFAKTA